MLPVEHIGIAVRSLEKSIPLYELLLNTPCYKRETVTREQVDTAFFRRGDTKIELLQSLDAEGVIARFIDKRGEGIHHIALAVDDIYAEIKRLKSAGLEFLHEEPKAGADNKLICFLHPKSTQGVLVELCMERPDTDSGAL
ncbi:MAG: methylmalonyl-CoA epimerase [Chitinophagaceae bacterium]|nr:methylmalonyl-CoA epimerase [Chitinophagaceae bacterium]